MSPCRHQPPAGRTSCTGISGLTVERTPPAQRLCGLVGQGHGGGTEERDWRWRTPMSSGVGVRLRSSTASGSLSAPDVPCFLALPTSAALGVVYGSLRGLCLCRLRVDPAPWPGRRHFSAPVSRSTWRIQSVSGRFPLALVSACTKRSRTDSPSGTRQCGRKRSNSRVTCSPEGDSIRHFRPNPTIRRRLEPHIGRGEPDNERRSCHQPPCLVSPPRGRAAAHRPLHGTLNLVSGRVDPVLQDLYIALNCCAASFLRPRSSVLLV